MSHAFADIAFTPAVKAVQEAMGSRRAYARFDTAPVGTNAVLGLRETTFITARDSFYMATVGETGWPYIQHRGGRPGFVRVLNSTTLGFADFRGNRQYVTVGNLAKNDRVSLFFMDYVNRLRLKLFGRARILAPDADAGNADCRFQELSIANDKTRIERGILIEITGFDWNCPQHIAERYTRADVEAMTAGLQARIDMLEARLAAPPPDITPVD